MIFLHHQNKQPQEQQPAAIVRRFIGEQYEQGRQHNRAYMKSFKLLKYVVNISFRSL